MSNDLLHCSRFIQFKLKLTLVGSLVKRLSDDLRLGT